jgi:uncharacterized protein YifE (UPF0438 family)
LTSYECAMSTVPPHSPGSRPAFVFRCSTHIFPVEEISALNLSGARLEALADGSLSPTTPEDEHFLQVDREEAEPQTALERAWVRLKGRREFEQDQELLAKRERPKDYGIIEWDREKCWW